MMRGLLFKAVYSRVSSRFRFTSPTYLDFIKGLQEKNNEENSNYYFSGCCREKKCKKKQN